jgi:DNA (cytosine-5)-methyltransferase 1
MTHGSLFSGIGGIDLGFEWAGIETKWQVEIDPYCRELLGKRFPNAKQFEDVKDIYRFTHEYRDVYGDREIMWCDRHDMDFSDCKCVGCSQWDDEMEQVDIISGGFPCTDISQIKRGAKGLKGDQSGLWSEMYRVVGLLQPQFVLIENVPMLTIRGGVRVIADLAEIGYSTEWQIVGADDVGAWHRRKRIWIVAYPNGSMLERYTRNEIQDKVWPDEIRRTGESYWSSSWTEVASKLCRENDGIPKRVDRLKGIGNAVVPHIPYIIGKRLKELCQKNQAEKPS